MASKLWAYGKRLTLWGALVSSLPVLFFPLMFFSVVSIAFSVPLGCSVAIYICFKKFYYTLFKEEVEVQKVLGVKGSEAREISGLQESESEEEKSHFPETTIHEFDVRPLGEETQKVEDYEGQTQAEGETHAISSGDGEEPHEGLSWTQAQKSEGEAPLIENLIPPEEAPEDEAQKGDAVEFQAEENWDPNEEAYTLQWPARKEQLDPVEEETPEVETHKDEEGEAQLKEECETHGEEEPLQEERETERGEEGQVQLKKKWNSNGETSPLEKIVEKESAFEYEDHYRVKDEDKVSEGEVQLKWDVQEEEMVDGRLAGPQEENARQDQAGEVETQPSLKKEEEVEVEVEVGVEVEVNLSEGEAQSDQSHGSPREHIGTKHKRKEEQDENNGKLYAIDTEHKIREEGDKEQDGSDEVKDVPHKRSRHEQALDLAPSTLYAKNSSTQANIVTPEETPHAGQQSVLAENPLGPSNLGVENGKPVVDNVASGLPIPPSSEIIGSSASEADKDSESLSEGAVTEDTEDAEHLWEEIHALRNIIGYKEDPHPLYAEEIKALYVLTGIEPPPSPKYLVDLDKAKEKLKLLKLVYGIK